MTCPVTGMPKYPRKCKNSGRENLENYLQKREQLRCLVIVMDSRHPLTEYDWQLIEWSQQSGIGLHCLLTKADKLSRSEAMKTLFAAQKSLEKNGVDATLQLFSALKKTGVDDAHELLDGYFHDDAV